MADRNITITLTPAQQLVVLEALGYLETVLEDEREYDGRGLLPLSHPLHRVCKKMREARRG